MLSTLFITLLEVASFLGYGALYTKTFRLTPPRQTSSLAWLLLIGLFVGVFFSLTWHFFFPINSFYTISFHLLGIFFFFWNFSLWKSLGKEFTLAKICFFAVWIILVGIYATPGINFYDSGLYHIPAIKWNREYPLIWGLGNLEPRLGFNSTWFLLSSLTQLPYMDLRFSFIPQIFLTIAWAPLLSDSYCEIKNKTQKPYSSLYILLGSFIFLTILRGDLGGISSPNTDAPSNLLLLYLFYLFIKIFEEESHSSRIFYFLVTSVLTSAILSIKISMAYLLFFYLLLSLMLFSKALLRKKTLSFKLLAFPTSFLALWGTQGVLLTGCIIYPLAQTCFDASIFPWSIPRGQVQSLKDWIESWAKTPGLHPSQVLSSSEWFMPWLSRFWMTYKSPLIILGLGLLVLTYFFLNTKRKVFLKDQKMGSLLIPISSGLIGIFVWFKSAPDPRFAHSLIWSLPLLLLLPFTRLLLASLSTSQKVYGLWIFFVFLILKSHALQALKKVPFVSPPPLPEFKTKIVEVPESHTKLRVPIDSDQCWDAPLPCTPYPQENLRIKKADNQIEMFYITGHN